MHRLYAAPAHQHAHFQPLARIRGGDHTRARHRRTLAAFQQYFRHGGLLVSSARVYLARAAAAPPSPIGESGCAQSYDQVSWARVTAAARGTPAGGACRRAGEAIELAAQLRLRPGGDRTELRLDGREVGLGTRHVRFERRAHAAQVLRRRAAAAADDARAGIERKPGVDRHQLGRAVEADGAVDILRDAAIGLRHEHGPLPPMRRPRFTIVATSSEGLTPQLLPQRREMMLALQAGELRRRDPHHGAPVGVEA